MKEGLTIKQFDILCAVDSYINNNPDEDKQGLLPTVREIQDRTGISSTSVVDYNINKLVDFGYLRRTSRISRSLRPMLSPMQVELSFQLSKLNDARQLQVDQSE